MALGSKHLEELKFIERRGVQRPAACPELKIVFGLISFSMCFFVGPFFSLRFSPIRVCLYQSVMALKRHSFSLYCLVGIAF